ncbi:hypothetical protein V2J09_019542 [Rumex salicifolius]
MKVPPKFSISLSSSLISPSNYNTIDHTLPISLIAPSAGNDGDGSSGSDAGQCHGFWYSFFLIVPCVLFVAYLAFNAKKNLKKLSQGRWHVMVTYYSLLWFATLLNLFWCFRQTWQCNPGKEVAWNLLSLSTTSAMLCLEMSLLGFLLQENYVSGLDSLARTFTIAGFAVSFDALLKGVYIFGFGIPMFDDGHITTHPVKWGLWVIHRLLLTTVYGYILFIHYSKWKEQLPPRPTFHRYVIVLFVMNVVVVSACGLAGLGMNIGFWYVIRSCQHMLSLALPSIPEEDIILDSAYYSEMRDAGFFDADWE